MISSFQFPRKTDIEADPPELLNSLLYSFSKPSILFIPLLQHVFPYILHNCHLYNFLGSSMAIQWK